MALYRIVGNKGYSFDEEIFGKVYTGEWKKGAVSLFIDHPHGQKESGGTMYQPRHWNFGGSHVNLVRVAAKKKKVKPPVPSQRLLSISYVVGQRYHLRNVISVVIKDDKKEINITYKKTVDGTEYRINFSLDFKDVHSLHFEDKVTKSEVTYDFYQGELHSVTDYHPCEKTFQH